DERPMTNERHPNDDEVALRSVSAFGHSSFLRHSSFELRHSFLHSCLAILSQEKIISTHSRAIPRSSSSRANYRSVFPSPREAAEPPSFCATSGRVPIHRDDKATPPAS